MSKRLWAKSPKGVEQAELTSSLHQKLSMVFYPKPSFVMILLEEPKTTTAERLLQAICCVSGPVSIAIATLLSHTLTTKNSERVFCDDFYSIE